MGDILYDTIFEVFDEDRDEEPVMPPNEPSAAAPPPPKIPLSNSLKLPVWLLSFWALCNLIERKPEFAPLPS